MNHRIDLTNLAQRSRRFPRSRRDVYRLLVKARRFLVHNVLHADDPPHRLALGVAIGMFVAITPTGGVQSVLVVLLAWLLGDNKVVGLPLVWISNPATAVPIYYPCYRLGHTILGGESVTRDWWRELAQGPISKAQSVEFYWSRLMQVIEPLVVGSLIVASVLAVVSYAMTYHLIVKFRRLRGVPVRGKAA